MKEYKLYGDEKVKKETVYEVIKVPLQDQVSVVRKFLSQTWKHVKTKKDAAKAYAESSMKDVRDTVDGGLKSVGIQDSKLVLQISAVGGGALVGLLLARKKSTLQRVLYPTLGACMVWGTIYCSSSENRAHLHSQIRNIQNRYVARK